MSSLSATQSDGYYLPPEYFESGDYKKVSRNQFAASQDGKQGKIGHNQWLKHGVVRFELPEKVVCLGCRHSIGRGTRYNAKKIKTDESYFSTPIFEFSLSCRNCKEPWVIRTDPKERGFRYVSGVKRQAGQDRHLVEDAVVTNMVANPLETLEENMVGKTRGLTELEELEGLVKLNQTFLEDADQNASIRKSFRSDRREKKRRLVGGQQLGFQNVALLPANDSDILQAKETSYGMASRDEQSNFRQVKRSSIFGKNRKPTRKQKTESRSFAPDSISSNKVSPATSSKLPIRTKVKISAGVLSMAVEKEAHKEGKACVTATNDELDATSDDKKTSTYTIPQKKSPLSFQDLVGAYDSSDED
eukprot:CAMPEP_0116134504 /NCGR_PEP_ID=MMETSP0329-20121206/10681_1 /TAXON_ID=697910 /ORGANISM="Pseudo-nitzschia arenysensis, Strain B593" /LENGTH=359 /DNA_ID=CAMNT_0003629219 /DNA_START=76 /DNA_END=1155 /DNA_ORIENTATION=-